jgi:hypothetical protein
VKWIGNSRLERIPQDIGDLRPEHVRAINQDQVAHDHLPSKSLFSIFRLHIHGGQFLVMTKKLFSLFCSPPNQEMEMIAH